MIKAVNSEWTPTIYNLEHLDWAPRRHELQRARAPDGKEYLRFHDVEYRGGHKVRWECIYSGPEGEIGTANCRGW